MDIRHIRLQASVHQQSVMAGLRVAPVRAALPVSRDTSRRVGRRDPFQVGPALRKCAGGEVRQWLIACKVAGDRRIGAYLRLDQIHVGTRQVLAIAPDMTRERDAGR
jgi:hypothetical protein